MNSTAPVHPLVLDPDFPALKRHVIESTGLAYFDDKDSDFAARISGRLSHLALAGCGAYLDLLKNREAGEPERHVLIGQLTIGETYFFRHSEQFDGLRDIALPDIIERNRERRTLRIWSAGCAIGAEPYTLAILLRQHFANQLAGWDVQILGTDINQAFLARAERGEFDPHALRSAPEDFKHEWFTPAGRSWAIKPFVKSAVSFRYHNLVEHPYPSIVHGITAMDLILCRNVMIYFDWASIELILGRFHECLVDGGWLAVGHAESNTELFRGYRTVNVPGATLYQKGGERSSVAYQPAAPVVPAAWPSMLVDQQPWIPPVLPAAPELSKPRRSDEPAPAAPSGLARVRRLADEGHFKDAARACAALIAEDQLNAVVHFYQGLIAEQTRQDAEAEQAFRRAIYLDRAFALAHYHLALLLEKTDRPDAAVLSLTNVQRIVGGMATNASIAEADGLTADDLRQLCDLHLEVWQK